MENDTTITKEGLLEPVPPGSVTFEGSILAPLYNSYLYEESKESFTYNSAQLIKNAALQKRYSSFRAEKVEQGYSEEELKESFGFLLLNDKSRANRLADTGLTVGQGTCTTLGDCSKGVYISKYSDCLDLKRWYDGKTGYIVLLKLTKGRVKEVAENYTQNFTPPTAGFDCHVSEQLRAVCATTSSFLAFERTQYYMYELVDGLEKVETCPRHVCPFAIVAFSYGKTSVPLELKEKSQEKSSFHYQPWSGQLEIKSVLYNIGLKSIHGALFPAKLPKIIKVDYVIGVSELRKSLPQAVFETSSFGEVSFDGKWFSMYDVIFFESGNDLAFLTEELKEKDMALVIRLEDRGFLVLLHPSNFLSYEGAGTDKAFALQGMFIYSESRTVPGEIKPGYHITKASLEVLQVLPALNYAESEMEKCFPKQNEEPLPILEKHLQKFAALIFPGLTSSPSRDSSMFPDQYDVPNGFPLISPKWTEQRGNRLKTYLKSPFSFQIPVSRSLELLTAGKHQRSDDHDDDVYYYISSPEAPQPVERDLPNEIDLLPCRNVSEDVKKTVAEINRPVALVAMPDNNVAERTDTPPTSAVPPIKRYLQNIHQVRAQDNEKTSVGSSMNDKRIKDQFSKATIETTSIFPSSDTGNDTFSLTSKDKIEVDSSDIANDTSSLTFNAEMEVYYSDRVNCVTDVLPVVGGQITGAEKLQEADLPTSISPPTTSVNRTEALTKGHKDIQPEAISDVQGKMTSVSNRRGRRRKRRKTFKRKIVSQITNPFQNTTLTKSTEATTEHNSDNSAIHLLPNTLKKDWRSLPRHKKDWNADVRIKRSLRSDTKNNEMTCVKNDETEDTTTITELTYRKNMSGTTKRKMEGVNMRERYGLKTIVTDCGFVFVPHGSEVAPSDIRLHENQQTHESSSVTTNSPVREKPRISPTHDKPQLSETESQRMLQTHILTNAALLSGDDTEKTSEQTSVLESTKKNKNTEKRHVYKAISISKLKTVLKRAGRTKSNPRGQENAISDTTQPKLKRSKPNNIELFDHSEQENTGSQEPALRTTQLQEEQSSKIVEAHGCNNFDNLSVKEMVKQAEQQQLSKPVDKRIEEKRSEGQRHKDKVADGVPASSDALNLLADLALSVNGDKMLHNLREDHLEPRNTGSPQTVINLLRDLAPRLKLPAKSPFPEGLVVTGDLILEISKEHSYSQPTSPLAGICSQDQPLVGCVKSRLSMRSNLFLKLPDLTDYSDFQNIGGKNRWQFLSSLHGAPVVVKGKVRNSLFLSSRSIVEKGGSIQVTRSWKENYDFKFDSKFTNDKLDKCVIRALHGKWDLSIEDSYEQVHLIFHMWIGLFYSKPTSRFFHFDQMCPTEERQILEMGLQCAVKNSTPLPDVNLTSKEDKHTSVDPVLDALDLSVKEPGTEDDCTSEKNPTATPETESKVNCMREDKMPTIEPDLNDSPTAPTEDLPMDYRSTVEALDENSASDYNDYSDTEDNTTKVKEVSNTQVLESTSTYGQLCDLASTIKIDDQKLLNEKNDEPVCEDQSMSVTTKINTTGEKDTGLQDVPVFHQVVGSAEPVHFNMHCLLPRKKSILKSLSFKDAHKDEVSVTVHSKTALNDEKCEAQVTVNEENHESTSECVNSRNNNESALEINTETDSVISVTISDKNDARVDVIHNENSSEKTKPVSAEKNNKVTINNIEDAPVDELEMSDPPEQQVESVINDTQKDVKNCSKEINVNDDVTEKVGPVPDIRDEIPIDKPDVNHETSENIESLCPALSENPGEVIINDEKNDKETSVPIRDDASDIVLDMIESNHLVEPVGDNTSLHDARNDTHEGISVENSPLSEFNDKNDDVAQDDIPVDVQSINSANKEASSKFDLKVDMLANVEIVNTLNEESTSGFNVKDKTPDVNESTEDKHVIQNQSDVSNSSSEDADMPEEMHPMEEHVSECSEDVINQSERKLGAEPNCDADTKAYLEDQNESVDWAVRDQGNLHEVNISRIETPPAVLMGDTEDLEEGEIKAEEHEESCCKMHTAASQAEISADHANSTSHPVLMLKESHSSSSVGGSCVPTQSESESKILKDVFVVQQDTPEISQYTPTEMCDNVFPLTIKYEITDSSAQGTSEIADELETPEMGPDQKTLVSTVSEWSPVKRYNEIQDNFKSMDLSPLALQIDSGAEVNSESCTPTLDEAAYSLATDEVSYIQKEMVQDTTENKCVKRKATNTWLALDSSEDSHSELEKSPAQKELILQDSSWAYSNYNTTIKETDEGKILITDDYVPDEGEVYPDYDAISTLTNTEVTELHQDQFGSFSEQYEDYFYEEPPPSWTRARFKTEQKNKECPSDEEKYYTNSISPHQEVAYSPRENNRDNPYWVQRMHYSESSPYVDKPNKKVPSFRHRAGLSKSNEEFGSQEAKPVHYSKMKRRKTYQYKLDEENFNAAVDFDIQKTFSCGSAWSSISRTRTSSPYQRKKESKQSFDWRRYFRRTGVYEPDKDNDSLFHDPPSSIVTMFDKKGNRVIFESPSIPTRASVIHGQSVEERQSKSATQSIMELEYLIFSEKMTSLLKNCKTTTKAEPQQRLSISPVENSLTVQFSRLDEQNNFSALDQTWPTLSKFKINVDMSERKALKKAPKFNKPLHLQRLFCETGPQAACSKLSAISKDCFKSYHTMMSELCIGKTDPQQNVELKRKCDYECATTSKQSGPSGHIKKDIFDHLHDNLNPTVSQACENKYKFFILVTSTDPFFEETKDLLEAEGHTAVEPYQFEFDAGGQIPLLIILRNEDIAQHIFQVPHLLTLKKSSGVLFVGIDQPDDVINLTHQELFAKGGFVVFDETALNTLSLENMKKFVGIVEELDKKGKWKWFLHYRDNRKLRENARGSPEAQRRKQFIDCCQEAGIVEVLPYHGCDVISRDRPDYLRCLVDLQVQNISARFPVFITVGGDMPYLDRHNRICGFLDIEDNENSGKFYRRYFILDAPRNCLLWYMDNPQNLPEGASSVGTLRLSYISKVSEVSMKQKPKTEFCFVINALSRRYFLQANNDADLKEWVIALNKATKITVPKNPLPVTQTDTVPVTSQTQSATRQAYKTAIVGGVVVQTPVQQNETDDVFTNEVAPHMTLRRCQSLRPNILRSGYCVKQGNVRKSWKRRFFILDDQTVSYYKNEMDKEPLRSIRLKDIQKVHECLVKSGDLLSRDNLFEIITNARTFYIQTDTPEEMNNWIKDIASKIQDFRGPSKILSRCQVKPPLIKSCSTAQSWQPWTPIPKKATRSVDDEVRESSFCSLPSLSDSQKSLESISRQRHHSQPQQSATDPHFAMDRDTHMRTSNV